MNLTQYDDRGFLRINVREVDNDILKDITIAEYESGRLDRVIRAKTGAWESRLGGFSIMGSCTF